MDPKHVGYLNKIVSRAPYHLRDDCRQAGLYGYLLAMKRRNDKARPQIKYFDTYVFLCMRNEVLSEIASLNGDGRGILSLDRKTFAAFSKHKRDGGGGGMYREKAFQTLAKAGRIGVN
jgi:hypothetical protein